MILILSILLVVMMGMGNDHNGKHGQVTKVSEPDNDFIVFLSDL